MSEEPKKEKKRAVDYAGIAALVTAIPTALATFYGIMSYQGKIDQKGTETKQYSTVLAQGAFNAQNLKIDALKDKDTELLLELAELRHELEMMKVTCRCGNKKDKHRPTAARKPASIGGGGGSTAMGVVGIMSEPMPKPAPESEVAPAEEDPSFEQIQEQAEEGAPWGQ